MTHRIRLDDPTAARLDCDAFARLLADWREGDLRPALHAAADRHAATCAPCGRLVADLDALRAAAAALPPLEPARDLWAGIEARIAPRVVTLPLAAAPTDAGAAQVRAMPVAARAAAPAWSRVGWAAAAAVLLVAGAGGLAWRAAGSGGAPTSIVAAAPTLPGAIVAPIASVDGARPPQRVASAGAATGTTSGTATSAGRARRPSSAAVATRAATTVAAVAAAPRSPLDVEIATLRRTLATRRGALDTATVRVLETNLAILDGAIRDSRAALVQEPTSRLLHEQLTQALDAKLELMRTAVILSGDE